MTGKMEFRDVTRDFKVLDVEIGVVPLEAIEEMDRPLAGDIIGNHDMSNAGILQDGSEDVVCIDIAI